MYDVQVIPFRFLKTTPLNSDLGYIEVTLNYTVHNFMDHRKANNFGRHTTYGCREGLKLIWSINVLYSASL